MKCLSIFLLVLVTGCVSTRSTGIYMRDSNIIGPKAEDEPEYELIVDDPGYQTWLVTNAKPIGYYSKSYYETKNKIYVADWNAKVTSFGNRRNSLFSQQINYDFNTDYGLELNYKLYNYFKFIHQKYGNRYVFPD